MFLPRIFGERLINEVRYETVGHLVRHPALMMSQFPVLSLKHQIQT